MNVRIKPAMTDMQHNEIYISLFTLTEEELDNFDIITSISGTTQYVYVKKRPRGMDVCDNDAFYDKSSGGDNAFRQCRVIVQMFILPDTIDKIYVGGGGRISISGLRYQHLNVKHIEGFVNQGNLIAKVCNSFSILFSIFSTSHLIINFMYIIQELACEDLTLSINKGNITASGIDGKTVKLKTVVGNIAVQNIECNEMFGTANNGTVTGHVTCFRSNIKAGRTNMEIVSKQSGSDNARKQNTRKRGLDERRYIGDDGDGDDNDDDGNDDYYNRVKRLRTRTIHQPELCSS